MTQIPGEEDTGEQATPAQDLASAVAIGLVALAAMGLSVPLEVPRTLLTAPGLLPFVTGLTLLVMAVALGVRAVRARGAHAQQAHPLGGAPFDDEARRTLLLIALVVVWVFLVALIDFDLSLPTPVFVFEISSYEVFSTLLVAALLRLFWGAALLRCVIVAFVTVEVLASIFRYGFGIVMPETF